MASAAPRVALVTGASRGLGRAMAEALAGAGWWVVCAARGPCADTVTAIRAAGGTALDIPADVRDEAAVTALVAQTVERCGGIDLLINNAGLLGDERGLIETDPALWRAILDTNLTGAYLCCRAVLPVLRARGGGVIVNISSGAAVRTGFLNPAYGVSKAGLDRLTLAVDAEHRQHGIACISLSPPTSATAAVRTLYAGRDVGAWAAAPELTARALLALLDDEPLSWSGKVVAVREYLRARGMTP